MELNAKTAALVLIDLQRGVLARQVVPHAADVMVTKRQWGAFYGTDLDLQLRRRGVHTLIGDARLQLQTYLPAPGAHREFGRHSTPMSTSG